MAYTRIKEWIAAEILTAANLNTEFSGCITNENDLDTRLVAEIATRVTLESEHDTLTTNVWNAGDSQIADNRVGLASMKDNSVDTAEICTDAITPDTMPAANKDGTAATLSMRTLGTGATQACAGTDSRLSDTRLLPAGGLTLAMCAAPTAGDTLLCSNDDTISAWDAAADYELKKSFHIIQAGTYRIKFTIGTIGSSWATRGRLYQKDTAVGTVRLTTSVSEEFSQDIALEAGTILGVWGFNNTAGKGSICNFRLYVANPCIPPVIGTY